MSASVTFERALHTDSIPSDDETFHSKLVFLETLSLFGRGEGAKVESRARESEVPWSKQLPGINVTLQMARL